MRQHIPGSTVLGLLWSVPARAHEEHAAGTSLLDSPFLWDVLLALVGIAAVGIYLGGAMRIAATGSTARLRWWETASFLGGWGVIFISLASPLDTWSDIWFSAHMTQHELLILIAAPLMVIGRPVVAGMWAFGDGGRQRLQRATAAASGTKLLMNPVAVVILHGATLWIWHIPALYERALQHEGIHAFQHLTFFGTAAMFWWTLVHGRFGKLGYGAAVFFVFVTMLHSGVLGALFTFSRQQIYPTHAARTIAAGGSALDDQQLAGLLMWIPAGILMMILGLALFAAWLGALERRSAISGR